MASDISTLPANNIGCTVRAVVPIGNSTTIASNNCDSSFLRTKSTLACIALIATASAGLIAPQSSLVRSVIPTFSIGSTFEQRPDEIIGSLQRLYRIDHPRNVATYLASTSDVITFLFRINGLIRDIFGDAALRLVVWESYEEDGPQLQLIVDSGMQNVDDILDLEDRMFERIQEEQLLKIGFPYVTISHA